jgi:hypothetical protein
VTSSSLSLSRVDESRALRIGNQFGLDDGILHCCEFRVTLLALRVVSEVFALLWIALSGSRSGSMANASASSHYEHIRQRVGDGASEHQVRFLSRSVFCCFLQVALQNYVSTFRDIAAADSTGSIKPLDEIVVRRLMIAPRLVQEAVMLESQHAGHYGVECLGCSARPCVLL